MTDRSTIQVLADHLRLRCAGKIEADLASNFAADAILLCQFAVFRGRDNIRAAAERVGLLLPRTRLVTFASRVERDLAFMEWEEEAGGARILDGADTFVTRAGLIGGQTMSFVLVSSSCRPRKADDAVGG